MNRRDFALTAMSGARGHALTPVQLQKLLFILDREIGAAVGGSGFDFQPYHYGPFDRRAYTTLEGLAREGFAAIDELQPARRMYRLSPEGQGLGDQLRTNLGPAFSNYIVNVCDFVRSQTFAGLVSSIYKAYPEMKRNSVFRSNE